MKLNQHRNINLELLIKGCRENDMASQEQVYKLFYGYAMSVCLRYVSNTEDAKEYLNNAFLKAFNKIHSIKNPNSFKSWFRSILVNSLIDGLRSEKQTKISFK